MIALVQPSPLHLPGTIWGLACFFNPGKFASKKINYLKFKEKLKRQNLPLLVVELAFENESFELKPGDADILHQVRSQGIFWQKERLLNLGLALLPKECDKVVWLDADIEFQNHDWVRETSALLEYYKIVQPFSQCIRATKNFIHADPIQARNCFNSEPVYSFVSSVVLGLGAKGHTGYAWAARRTVMEAVGFLDTLIVGGADVIMAHAFLGIPRSSIFAVALEQQVQKWRQCAFQVINASVHFVPGFVLHYEHGKLKSRKYVLRHQMLIEHHFNPTQDLILNSEGAYEWSEVRKKSGLLKAIQTYFVNRNEDQD